MTDTGPEPDKPVAGPQETAPPKPVPAGVAPPNATTGGGAKPRLPAGLPRPGDTPSAGPTGGPDGGKPPPPRSGPPPQPPSPQPPPRYRDRLAWACLVGFVVLAAAIVWVWQNPRPTASTALSADIAVLDRQVQALQARLTGLEQRPVSAEPDLAPLTAKVAALEAQLGALEKRPAGDPTLGGRMDTLAGRVDALASRVEANGAAVTQRQDAMESKLAALANDAGQINALADRATRTARIQVAQAALDAGLPLGDIPGAPAALIRYAAAAPPTEAGLRLAFPAAAAAALAASRPQLDNQPFLDRVWARVQSLVTLRQGDRVILGDPAAGIVARARAALDAGDLAGTVTALDSLSGPPAAAVAGWKSQAQGLLDARKALADMAAHA